MQLVFLNNIMCIRFFMNIFGSRSLIISATQWSLRWLYHHEWPLSCRWALKLFLSVCCYKPCCCEHVPVSLTPWAAAQGCIPSRKWLSYRESKSLTLLNAVKLTSKVATPIYIPPAVHRNCYCFIALSPFSVDRFLHFSQMMGYEIAIIFSNNY